MNGEFKRSAPWIRLAMAIAAVSITLSIGGFIDLLAFSYVADADARIGALEQLAQSGSNVSGSAGNQNGLHESLVHSLNGICYGLFRTVLSREPLIALAAVEEMALHGLAGLRNRVGVDRLQYLLVFLLERFKLDATRGRGRPIPD